MIETRPWLYLKPCIWEHKTYINEEVGWNRRPFWHLGTLIGQVRVSMGGTCRWGGNLVRKESGQRSRGVNHRTIRDWGLYPSRTGPGPLGGHHRGQGLSWKFFLCLAPSCCSHLPRSCPSLQKLIPVPHCFSQEAVLQPCPHPIAQPSSGRLLLKWRPFTLGTAVHRGQMLSDFDFYHTCSQIALSYL
jgi:hypothetical protein